MAERNGSPPRRATASEILQVLRDNPVSVLQALGDYDAELMMPNNGPARIQVALTNPEAFQLSKITLLIKGCQVYIDLEHVGKQGYRKIVTP